MSGVRDVIGVIKDTLLLNDKVDRLSDGLEALSKEVIDHEKRLIRLETRWETAMELSRGGVQRIKE